MEGCWQIGCSFLFFVHTFGVLKQAQAIGDFEVLVERDRRALRVHLGPDVPAALAKLRERIEHVLK